ncbi:ribonuclease III [bacterium]|nr:ribonuclease III [bacterium]
MTAHQHEQVIGGIMREIEAEPAAREMFRSALTHRSWVNESLDRSGLDFPETNERLEYLGDSVLGLVIAKQLYNELPQADEGELTKAKAGLVCTAILARHARRLELGPALLLGHGEELSGGRERISLLADTMEAVIGAVFITCGFTAAEKFILKYWETEIEREIKEPGQQDYKSLLQEFCHKRKKAPPVYRIEQETGPDHERQYVMAVLISGRIYGQGRGRTKKQAAQDAAAEALSKLKKEEA